MVNADTTVCIEVPKIKPYIEKIQNIIAAILKVSAQDVSVKATTTERMGFAGREEGVVAYATVLLKKAD